MNIKKIAESDAAKWARAEMFFGDGAGTRRKLLSAEIAKKVENISGYHEAFERALGKQDMAEHAIKAAQERQKIDRARKISRNVRGLTTGNKQSLTTGVAVLATAYWYAHETGYDKIIFEKGKVQYRKARLWVRVKQHDLNKKKEAVKEDINSRGANES